MSTAANLVEAPVLRPPARAAVTKLLRSLSADLAAFGVAELWLFGSVARGDDDEDSDIDIAARLVDPFVFEAEYDIAAFLRKHFTRHVDFATLPFGERLAATANEDLVRVF